jgi:hypothetical protein
MSIMNNLWAAADPVGLAVYLGVMTCFLGSVRFAGYSDERVTAHKAARWRRSGRRLRHLLLVAADKVVDETIATAVWSGILGTIKTVKRSPRQKDS